MRSQVVLETKDLNFVCWLAEYANTITVTMAGNVYSFGVILQITVEGRV